MSEGTSEWPSAYVPILGCSAPLCIACWVKDAFTRFFFTPSLTPGSVFPGAAQLARTLTFALLFSLTFRLNFGCAAYFAEYPHSSH